MNAFKVDGVDFILSEDDYEKITINSHPKPYEVNFGAHSPKDQIADLLLEGDVLVIDSNVKTLYDVQYDGLVFEVEAREGNKNIQTVLSLATFLSNNGFNKKNKLICVGGGITQDIVAFCSKIYKRGISWIFLPTTLLSMCDSCIGGKTGINYGGAKNQLALFSSPSQIYINAKFLETLEPQEIKSGCGEIVKLFAMAGEEHIDFFLQNHPLLSESINCDNLLNLIKMSLLIKKQIVEYDEFEFHIRQSLNYGHTIGHAIEVLTSYQVPHGVAVCIGMLAVDQIFNCENIKLQQACYPFLSDVKMGHLDSESLRSLLLKDKKTIGTVCNFIVLNKPGEIRFVKKQIDDVLIQRIKLFLEKF